jgi:thiamine biosynthesis lipoprotein
MAAEAPATATGRGLHRVEAVMGIPVGIDVRDDGVDPAALDRAFAHLHAVDAAFSTHRPDSDVSRIAAGTLAPRDARPEVRAVLARCEALRRATGGRFDVRATGRLDPSGFVKGWAVDGAVAILRACGARNLCVHAGGDVRVAGERAPGLPWRIGVQHPLDRRRVAAVLHAPASGLSVATSGAYERGEHIVDPRTGRPARGVLSVTIAGPDLGPADAYATAAFAMGAGGPAWTATLPGHAAMTILDGGRVLSTSGMADLRADAPDAADAADAADA